MSEVSVYDDVVSDDVLDLLNYEFKLLPWIIHGSTQELEDSGKNTFFMSNTSHIGHYKYLFNIFNKKFSLNLKLVRAYVNLYPPSISGDWHYDDGDMTMLLYPTPWKDEYGGQLEFDFNQTVPYRRNRLVVFPTDLRHRSLINKAPFNRYSVAWKTIIK